MQMWVHFVTSIILTAGLFPLLGWHSLWAFVGGFLIDFDHYLYSFMKFKDTSIAKSYKYHAEMTPENYEKDMLHLFHTVEFWIFMLVGAAVGIWLESRFIFSMFLVTFMGMVLHVMLDMVSMTKDKMLDGRAHSLIKWWKRHKKAI